MAGIVSWLPDAPGTERNLPVFGSASPIRKVTRQVAFEDGWDAERREKIGSLFDSMADEWSKRATPEREAALSDALDRGNIRGGRVIELGSGTGAGTRALAGRFESVVALDLSLAMLQNASPALGGRVQGDSSALPFPDGAADTITLVNMLLFPREIDRVLDANGQLLWVNSMAEETPIHLPPEDVLAALPGEWSGVAGRAGTGLWLVAERR